MAGLFDGISSLFQQKVDPNWMNKQYNVDPKKAEEAAMTAMFAAPDGVGALGGMLTWHGSPYKFNAFDASKIGKGEGHQAYGYGHYVAESPDVAKGYKRNTDFASIKREFLDNLPEDANIDEVVDLIGTGVFTKEQDQVLKQLDANDWLGFDYPSQAISAVYSKNLKNYDPSPELMKALEDSGNLYKIDLPDEQVAKMLDWDLELGKQSPEIQKLAKEAGLAMDDLGGDLVARIGAKKPAGAEAMREAGIPGIKYFDAQSRGGKQAKTRNFVVFPKNEHLLDILDVNPLDYTIK